LRVLIVFLGIIFGFSLHFTHGFIFNSLFYVFIGLLGWDFGMRFFDDNDDDDFDGGQMIPSLL
tara:strand:- start:41 stop:229 length:189 start_codon:yes stop_codon:yes gene_type:complete